MKKILFVEDEPGILDCLSSYFSNFAKVFTAAEGKAGLKILQQEKIDIVVTDLNMPNGMSGFEFIDLIHKDPEHKPGQLFVLSGYNDNKIASLKIDGFFAKPVKLKELKHIILKEAA